MTRKSKLKYPFLLLLCVVISCDSNEPEFSFPLENSPLSTITSPDSDTVDFGSTIAIKDDLLIVTGFGPEGSGRVYAFRWDGTTGTFLNRLDAPETSANSPEFAKELAICNNTVFVGAPQSNLVLFYKYDGNSIEWAGGIRPSAFRLIDGPFPTAISCEDRTAVFSLSGYTGPTGAKDGGAIFFYFENNGVWNRGPIFAPPEPAEGDEFGISVDISGNTVAVGATANGTDHPNGVAHVFRSLDRFWDYDASFDFDEIDKSNRFGRRIQVFNNQVAVGAVGNTFRSPPGQIHLFNRGDGQWTSNSQLSSSAAETVGFGDTFLVTNDGYLLARESDLAGTYSIVVYSQINILGESIQKAYKSPSSERTPYFGVGISEINDKILISDPERNEVYVFSK